MIRLKPDGTHLCEAGKEKYGSGQKSMMNENCLIQKF